MDKAIVKFPAHYRIENVEAKPLGALAGARGDVSDNALSQSSIHFRLSAISPFSQSSSPIWPSLIL